VTLRYRKHPDPELRRELARVAIDVIREDAELIERGAKSREQWGRLANAVAPSEAQRDLQLRRLAGYLVAHGSDPELVLRLLECWDAAHNAEPLGLERVEEVVRWVADREADKLERRHR
jgi:hypothetical protein